MAAPLSAKDEALRLVQGLDEDATWADIIYLLYIREKRERGKRDSDAGRVATLEEVRRRFGIATP
jgi:hypothetical protein